MNKYGRRVLTCRDKENITLLHFGSLEDFGGVLIPIPAVAKRLHIAYSTVINFIRRLKTQGIRALADNRYSKSGLIRPKVIGSPEVEMLLLSDVYMTRWSTYSLRERCEKIRQKWGIVISISTLIRFYKRHDIKFRKTYKCFRGEAKNQERLKIERMQFATKLAYLQRHGQDIIYFDETVSDSFPPDLINTFMQTFNCWTRLPRTWYSRFKSLVIP
jgi:transposase